MKMTSHVQHYPDVVFTNILILNTADAQAHMSLYVLHLNKVILNEYERYSVFCGLSLISSNFLLAE